jgi:tetratricopeptide (TPR) repeat protein
MESFACLNNAGTLLLSQGKFQDSIETLARSLRSAKLASADLSVNRANETSASDSTQERKSVVFPMLPLHSQDFLHSSLDAPLSMEEEGLYFCPLNLSEMQFCDWHASAIEISSTIIYNLALAFHMHAVFGVCSDCDAKFSLQQAVKLYEMAYTVNSEAEDETFMSLEFNMALINNLGHAYRTLGNAASAEQCFLLLLSMIMFLRSADPTANIHTAFINSTTHLVLREAAASAA